MAPTWILGFDGDCATCAQLAAEVARLADGRLTVRSLREPEVAAWRVQALGPDAPWTPTLFRIAGDQVQAWTGRQMAWQLARLLGPGRALTLASQLAATSGGWRGSRRAVLRQLGGMALAANVLLSGSLSLPRSARATKSNIEVNSFTALQSIKSYLQAQSHETSTIVNWLRREENWIPDHGWAFSTSIKQQTYSGAIIRDKLGQSVVVTINGLKPYAAKMDSANSMILIYAKGESIVSTNRPTSIHNQGLALLLQHQQVDEPVLSVADTCCPVCVTCIALDALCAGIFICCVTGSPLAFACCPEVVGSCLTAASECSISAGCNCLSCLP